MKVKKIALVAFGVTAAALLEARTVALWPMEYDAARGTANMRCAISSANGFTVVPSKMTFEKTTVGWNLPPNPDATTGKLFSPTSFYDFVSSDSSTGNNNLFKVDSLEISELFKLNRDFTLEGWIKPWAVQDKNWHIIFQSNGGGTGYFSWAIRNDKIDTAGDESTRHFGFYAYVADGYLGDTEFGADLTAAEAIDLTNSWHHVALVFDADGAGSKGQFTMYYDGVKRGSAPLLNAYTDFTPASTLQTFGGRTGGQICKARWNYWRLSDEALDASELLNAGGSGTVVPEPAVPTLETTKTIAYWKLGVDAAGNVNAHDFVGDFDLSRGLLDYTSAGKTDIEKMPVRSAVAVSSDKPFVQPPNTTVTITGGLRGSFRGGNAYAAVLVDGPGTQVELDNDFTVEAYVRFLNNEGWQSRYAYADSYLFGTVHQSPGSQRWVLREVYDTHELKVMVHNFDTDKNEVLDAFCSAPADTAWHHLALVYDSTANARTWTLYLDGKLTKTIGFTQAVAVDPDANFFALFGRGGPDSFPGEIACVRISKTKLSTDQFLCESAKAKAATNVLAFWPLDTADGVTPDGRDLVGSYSFTHGAYDGDDYKLTPVADDQPIIANPENKLGVYAQLTDASHGAVRFRNGTVGKKSYLYYARDTFAKQLRGTNTEWTVEFYTKRSAAPEGKYPGDLIFAVVPQYTDYTPSPNSGHLTVAYGTEGFAVYDHSVSEFRTEHSHYMVACSGTVDAIPLNEWAHVAVTRRYNEGTVTYAFYVNGTKKGEMSGTVDSTSGGDCVFFGGCYNFWDQECAWNGLLSSLRVTAGVRDPSDFLCATPATLAPQQAVETLAYWPFDYKDARVDLTPAAGGEYTPWGLDRTLIAGSTDCGAYRMESPCADLPIPKQRNFGSVALTRGAALTYPGLAENLGYDRAFTVEGLINWTSQTTTKEEILFGACGRTDIAHGWRVFVDYSSTVPALKIFGNAPSGDYGAVVGETLVDDLTSWNGVWKQIALVYDPTDGTSGTWKFYVDRTLVKTLESAWYPGVTPWLQNYFAIGAAEANTSTGFTGIVDAWRVVTKALAPEELLKSIPRPGLMLLVK